MPIRGAMPVSVTIKDVARAAGVSVASVSRALNGHSSVTDATRVRIKKAAAKLRYMPNSAARSLITQRTQTIGALLPDLHGAFFSELIRGIDLAARERGMHLLVSSSHGDSTEAAAALNAMRGRVDGLLVMSPHADAHFIADNVPAELPLVLMNTWGSDGGHTTLTVDNYGGAMAMMQHLCGLGLRRIAFVSGPVNNFEAQERLRGYREGLRDLAPGAEPLVLDGDFTEASGYRAAMRVLKTPPQAIFAANDMMALGCLSAISDMGLRVPHDVALGGFDDIPMAHYTTPSLTTVRVPIAHLGSNAMERVCDQIAHRRTNAVSAQPRISRALDVGLVIRDSTSLSSARDTRKEQSHGDTG